MELGRLFPIAQGVVTGPTPPYGYRQSIRCIRFWNPQILEPSRRLEGMDSHFRGRLGGRDRAFLLLLCRAGGIRGGGDSIRTIQPNNGLGLAIKAPMGN